MPLQVYRLRRILLTTAVLLTIVVISMYFYARSRATNVLKSIPGKMGYDIKQTASGFQFSKSDGKRTLFTVQASDVKEFKINGNAELHKVSIVLYGRDSSRFDQIYGDDFAYNQKTGDVSAKGDVQIDLVANPAGLASADQAAPKELKNPIHLKTRDLVFNKESGNASTDSRVELRTPQASGSAVGVSYAGKNNVLTLSSQVHVELNGPKPAVLDADRGLITNEPRTIVLDHPRMKSDSGTLQADQATVYLDSRNHVERVLATGNVTTHTRLYAANKKHHHANDAKLAQEVRGRSDQAEFSFVKDEDILDTAILSGNIHVEQSGMQTMLGDAGRVIVDFTGKNEINTIHAADGVHLSQKTDNRHATENASALQNFELAAPTINFVVDRGRVLRSAETAGAAQITILQSQPQGNAAKAAEDRTVVTAGKFTAEFSQSDGTTRLAAIHGAPDARIVNTPAGQPERTSTSDSVDASFLPLGGIESVTQKGNVVYSQGEDPAKRLQAFSSLARYSPANQMLVLTGEPRVTNGGMQTTANTIRINRATGDATAEGDVKSTYSELKEQPNGALLASSSSIHVTAATMSAHNNPGIALYSGGARLWQDANIIQAPSIQFDRDHRSLTAQGSTAQPVQTILVQPEKPVDSNSKPLGSNSSRTGKISGKSAQSSPIVLTGLKLTYSDSERRVHYEGGVMAKAAEFSASADTVDAYLLPHGQTSAVQELSGPGQLDHMVAQGKVVIQQPKRRAEGQNLVYTALDDKFVLTGGPPSIFDAEQGKITGVSLTFFRRDDRVLVEGEASTPVVTTTRVAR